MTITGAARSAAVVVLLLGLAACAGDGAGGPGPSSPSFEPAATEGLVLQIEHTGGFVTPAMLASRMPVVSVYADGRVITQGPVIAIYPAPALPNLQVHQIQAGDLQELVDRALAAGVAETADLGMPPVADVATTRFTLVTASETYVREVYALTPPDAGSGPGPDPGLSTEQLAGRAQLWELQSTLTGLGSAESAEPYVPDAITAIVTPWRAPEDDITPGIVSEPVPWPGPPLPGEPLGALPDLTCVTATGDAADAVLAAAREANGDTPWLSADGTRWSVAFRPLLPHESGCADLAG